MKWMVGDIRAVILSFWLFMLQAVHELLEVRCFCCICGTLGLWFCFDPCGLKGKSEHFVVC